MKGENRDLGMGAAVTRRDFVHGAAAFGAMAAMPGAAAAAARKGVSTAPSPAAIAYPPLRTGYRGFHPGSFEPIHTMSWQGGNAPPEGRATGEMYDLVIVGGGLSGLAAAYYYRKRAGPKARILILDNLQGVGGHAQRNEFEFAGRKLYAGGGSGYVVSPSQWPAESKAILDELGIVKDKTRDRSDRSIYTSLGLGSATLFPKEQFGTDKVVHGSPAKPTPEFLAQTPLSPQQKADLDKLFDDKTDHFAGKSDDEKVALLRSMSYRDYLLKVVKISESSLPFVKGMWCLGLDMATAWFAFFRMRPGFAGLGLTVPEGSPEGEEAEADDYSLPAGNSDVARLLVRALIPDALPPGDLFEVADKRLDYSVLDRASNPTRIRQSSIVYNVRHLGPQPRQFEPDHRDVQISYLNDGQAVSVKAGAVVMACMNNVIPYICPEIPDVQKVALKTAVRAPNQMTNVLFRDWRAFAAAKISNLQSPWTFYATMGLANPRFFGDVVPSRSPAEPIIVSFGTGANSGILSNAVMVDKLCGGFPPSVGTPAVDQFRAVRVGLLQTPFETFEHEVRDLSTRALAGTDFDPARDILGITVNRWSHGFTTGLNDLFDTPIEPGVLPPMVVARQRVGKIAIANSDAGRVSTMGTAFEQAHRAIMDLEPRKLGFYDHI